jgi:hypothetical protein
MLLRRTPHPPCSRILHVSASLGGGTPVDLRDTVTGLDTYNTGLLITAIRHATGKRSENSDRDTARHGGNQFSH